MVSRSFVIAVFARKNSHYCSTINREEQLITALSKELDIEALFTIGYNGTNVIKGLKEKLSKTRKSIQDLLDDVLRSGRDRDLILDELTEVLILSDIGYATAEKIIAAVRTDIRKSDSVDSIRSALQAALTGLLLPYSGDEIIPKAGSVFLFVGVNGGGKTTSLAKLAARFKEKGLDSLLVAGDTFRAAAREQLSIWGKRINSPVIQGPYEADPASVVYDAVQSYKARGTDLLLIDTAGRVHTNANLMNELEKIRRVLGREIEGAPHEIFLVLDASIGQNAVHQAREFLKFSGLTGIILTKLDGTAKGGSVVGIVDELKLPIRYIGVGEGLEDIHPFLPKEFVDALLS
ncbi:MAG: signal recognition particle-docking protein FtsY [Acidobacteria bacterium]|nr:signal recognition particle-docking protein FtsY [Acidobacteriota bacterium]